MDKFQSDTYNSYKEIARILSNPGEIHQEYEELNRLQETIDHEVCFKIQNNHREISKYLANIQESESALIDYIAFIKDIRKELRKCKEQLNSEKINPYSIWLKKVYFKHLLQGLKELNKLRDTQDTVENMIKEKLFDKAGEVISKALYRIEKTEFNYMPIYEIIKESFLFKLNKLSDIVIDELKSLLFMRNPALDFDFKKYFTTGVLNIQYFLGEENTIEHDEIKVAIPALLNSLESAKALEKVENLYHDDIQKDLVNLYRDCFSQLNSRDFQVTSRKRDNTISCLLPTDSVKEMSLRICNGVTAISALVLRNHFIFTKCLKQFNRRLGIQELFESVQREIRRIFRTLARIPDLGLQTALSVDMASPGAESEDNPYKFLLDSLLPLNAYNFPSIYSSLKFYIEIFNKNLAGGSVEGDIWSSSIEEQLVQFLETLRSDTWNLYLPCVTNPDSFKSNRANEFTFPAVSVFEKNLECLEDFAKKFPGHHSVLVRILNSMLFLVLKEIVLLYDKQASFSGFNEKILSAEDFFQDLRATPEYHEIRLNYEGDHKDLFLQLYLYKYPTYEGLYARLRSDFVTFKQAPWKKIIQESSRLCFFATLVRNLEKLFNCSTKFIMNYGENTLAPSGPSSPVQSLATQKSSFKGLMSLVRSQANRPKNSEDAMPEDGEGGMNPIEFTAAKFRKFIKEVQKFHDKALFLLKSEIELNIFNNLQLIKNRIYWRDIESTYVEGFINAIICDVVKIHAEIRFVLPPEKLAFIWEGVFESVCTMFIYGLKEIQDANLSKQGLAVYIKNAKIMQEQFFQLDIPNAPQQKAFLKLYEYLEMLHMSEKALIRYIHDNAQKFSAKEFEIMVKLKVPARANGVSQQFMPVINRLLQEHSSNN